MGNKVKDSDIINFLVSNDTYISALKMADEFNVSPKTIYRRVNEINKRFDGRLIKSEKGKGYKIISSKINSLKINSSSYFKDSPSNRRKNVILKLLFNSPQFFSINFLYRDTYISRSTVNSDLIRIKKMLADFGLVLIRRNGSVSVYGEEKNIRETINSFLRYDKGISSATPIEGISRIDASFVQEQIDFIQHMSQAEISYPYNINVYSHIYILIQRVRNKTVRGNNIYNNLNRVPLGQKEKYPDLYRISEMVIQNVSSYIVKSLPDFEVDYLFRYLLSSRLVGPVEENSKDLYSPFVEKYTTLLIDRVSGKLGEKLDKEILKNELIRHIGPMVNRIKNNIFVENELLGQIKNEYHKLYELIKKECREVSSDLNIQFISDNEVGFITLYFEKNLEISLKQYHVWLVCASGVGTSELLKVQIQHEFSNIIVDKVMSSFDENLYKTNEKVDLIITTVNFSNKLATKSVTVTALLNNQDKRKIKEALYG